MERSFARACPTHRCVLRELRDGRLRCPRSRHRLSAWVVVDVETGEVLGAAKGGGDSAKLTRASIWLGPRLELAGDLLRDLGVKHYALPLPARPAAA